jgi:hypothetical protein
MWRKLGVTVKVQKIDGIEGFPLARTAKADTRREVLTAIEYHDRDTPG